MPSKEDKWLRFYRFYGLDVSKGTGNEHYATCFSCEGIGKLHINSEDGRYNCKVCDESGNNYTFLRKISSVSGVSDEAYRSLSERRGIAVSTLRELQLCPGDAEIWYLPASNPNGKLVNVYKIEESDGKLRILSGPLPCTQQLYRADTLTRNHKRVYITEGHWDAMVLVESLAFLSPGKEGKFRLKSSPTYNNKLLTDNAVLAVPGATTIKTAWMEQLDKRHLVLCFDNDAAGQKGIEKFLKEVEKSDYTPASIKVLQWPEGNPHNDLRDVYNAEGPLKTFRFIEDNIGDLEVPDEDDEVLVEAKRCVTFNNLINHFSARLEMTKNIRFTLATMIAVILSTRAKGSQLALRVIGPPGSVKSTLAECLSQDRRWVYPRSKFTGIVTGYVAHKQRISQTAEKMNGKCLIIKDADTMTQLPNLKQVESELRDALGDGVIRAEYRTGAEVEVHSRFTVIECGTQILKQMDDSNLGSRFVDIFIHERTNDSSRIVRRAITQEIQSIRDSLETEESDDEVVVKKNIDVLAPYVVGFIQAKKALLASNTEFIEPSEQQQERIQALAELISLCRCKVERNQDGSLKYRPQPEVATRLGEHLTRLAVYLAVVFSGEKGPVQVTEMVFAVLKKVARNTVEGFPYEIVTMIHKADEKRKSPLGMTSDQVAHKVGLSVGHTRTHMSNLADLELIQRRTVPNPHGRGRPTDYFILTPEIRELCRKVL